MSTSEAKFAHAIQLFDQGQFDQAERACRSILEQDSRAAGAMRLLAMVFDRQGRTAEAIDILGRALDCQPRIAMLWFERGAARYKLGDATAALVDYRRAAELDPTFYEAVLNVGAVLEQLEQLAESLEWTRRAVALRPTCARAQYNLGSVFRGLGEITAAVTCFEQAVQLDPAYAKAHWNLSQCDLLLRNFARGWAGYEWREKAAEVFLDRHPQPRWDGSALNGRTLLAHAEQGIGDEILFASCYPDLLAQGGRCLFVCEPRLVSLFQRSFPQASVHGYQRRNDWAPLQLSAPVDFQIAAGSVPGFLRRRGTDFPQRDRFLIAEAAAVERWRARLAELGPGLKVGISWRAGGKPSERQRRTTELAEWAGLLGVPGVQWVNLQYGETLGELAQVRDEQGVVVHDPPGADPLIDLDEFAAKVSALDLVISVGNATAHLAGGLGTPGWIVLPRVPAWRWHLSSSTTPWYPSLRLYRQTAAGWDDVFRQLQTDLESRVGARASGPAIHPNPTTRNAPQPVAPVAAAVGELFRGAQASGDFIERALPAALARAEQLHRAGQLESAEVIYREILSLSPRQPEAQRLLGILARQTGRVQLAISSLERALAAGDGSPDTPLHLAESLKAAGQLPAALAAYEQAIERSPQAIELRVERAGLLAELGRNAEAIGELEAALDADPGHLPTLDLLVRLLPAAQRQSEADQLALVATQLRQVSARTPT